MNLKKFVVAASLLLLSSALFAQPVDEDNGGSKFYIKAYAGYVLLNPGGHKLVSKGYQDVNGPFTTSKAGMGAGLRFGGGIGVIASDFINIGVDVDYLNGTTLNSSTMDSDVNVTPHTVGVSKTRMNYNSLSIIPHVIFKAISKPDYLIYTKVGVIANLPLDLKYSSLDSLVPSGTANNFKRIADGTYKIPLTAGLSVAFGLQYRLTDNIRAFGEIFGHFLSLTPKQYDEVVTTSGTTPSRQTNHIVFAENGTGNYTANPDNSATTSSQPAEGNRFNMNTLGINIGLTYRF